MYSVAKQTRHQEPDNSALDGSRAKKAANHMSRLLYPYAASRELSLSTDHRGLLSDKKFTAAVLDEIGKMIVQKGIETLSFDVFDTALLRAPHCEATRFYTVAEQFAKQHKTITATDALVARAMAARAAYTFANAAPDGTREGTMSTIAEITCSELCLPKFAGEYIKTELAFEEKHLTPNPLVVAIINTYPSLRTIFLSDMYLESRHIKKLLQEQFGKMVEVISSADGYGSKRCGGLYGHAATALGIDLTRTLHFGDSLESDFRQAKRNGLHAYYLPLADTERNTRRACYGALGSKLAPAGVGLQSVMSFNC